jgi:signal transduction histidine kinase
VPGSAAEAGAAGYRPLLFSIAYGMTGSVGDAEDIVQDAFLGLTRARQAGTVVADQKAYLTTAVTRLGINYLRSARRHAPGAAVDVELRYEQDLLLVRVRDNGPGPGPAGTHAGASGARSAGSGHGLLGMRERAVTVGGTLRTGAAPGGGFLVEAELPAKPETGP